MNTENNLQPSETLDTSKEAAGIAALPLFNEDGTPSDYYKALPRVQRKAMWGVRGHPKFIDAQLTSHRRKAKRFMQEEALKSVTAQTGARFMFYGRLTVCYERRKNTILIATSLRNPKDENDRLEAKSCAMYRLLQGQYIVIPTNKDVLTTAFINDMFFPTVC